VQRAHDLTIKENTVAMSPTAPRCSAWATSGRGRHAGHGGQGAPVQALRGGPTGFRSASTTAKAIAACVPDDEFSPEHIVPSVFDPQVAPRVAAAVSLAAIEEGVVRLHHPPQP
jgi:hypothetical protein